MDNRVYYTMEDGTLVDDKYVAEAIKKIDRALQSGKAEIQPNPHRRLQDADILHSEFNSFPPDLKKELKPFMLSAHG